MGLKWWRVLALCGLCGLLSGIHPAGRALAQEPSSASPSSTPATTDSQAAPARSAPEKTTPDPSGKKPAPRAATHKPAGAAKKAAGAPAHPASARRKKRPMSPRVRRIREAFVASTTLRPMAQQLVQDRTPQGYAGVEAYAKAHAKEDAGALAWLVVGYAHFLDHEYAKAIDPLSRAKPLAEILATTSHTTWAPAICKPGVRPRDWPHWRTSARRILIRCWCAMLICRMPTHF